MEIKEFWQRLKNKLFIPKQYRKWVSILLFFLLAISIPFAVWGLSTGRFELRGKAAFESGGLRELADEQNVELGAQTVLSVLNDPLWDPNYIPTLTKEFNTVLTDGELAWSKGTTPLRPNKDTFDFSQSDAVIAFAESNQMQVQAHHLVWGYDAFIPLWLKDGNFSRDEMLAILENHVRTVAGHYKGRVKTWTVVNEALYGPSFINNIWYQKIGPEYIGLSFHWAKEADPNAILIYNDNSNELINSQSDHMFEMVQQFKQEGVPIDGVGMEMHLDGATPPDKANVLSNMQRFSQLGVRVYVTEFDVNMSNVVGTLAEKQAIQAKIYKEMLEACLESNACNSFMVFGVNDRVSWLYDIPGSDPLPIDKDYIRKPAYYEMVQVLAIPTSAPTITPSITQIPFINGDINRDGKVNLMDYNLLVQDFGKTGDFGFSPADINQNGKVDIFDFNLLVENFGKTSLN